MAALAMVTTLMPTMTTIMTMTMTMTMTIIMTMHDHNNDENWTIESHGGCQPGLAPCQPMPLEKSREQRGESLHNSGVDEDLKTALSHFSILYLRKAGSTRMRGILALRNIFVIILIF